MTTADDLRDLRDALDSIVHGALPRWGKPSTKTEERGAKWAIDERGLHAKRDTRPHEPYTGSVSSHGSGHGLRQPGWGWHTISMDGQTGA